MSEINEGLPHGLVETDSVSVLHELSHNLSLVVLHHQHFLRLSHVRYQHHPNLGYYLSTSLTGIILIHKFNTSLKKVLHFQFDHNDLLTINVKSPVIKNMIINLAENSQIQLSAGRY